MDKIDTRIFHLECFIRSLKIESAALFNKYGGNPPKDKLDILSNKKADWKNELKELIKHKTRLQKINKITGNDN
jgi:hypothetical protein